MHKLNLIITGFLGSGKTTFILRSLVGRYRSRKLSIIVNDFGSISYDKVMLYNSSLAVLGVEGKCMCCGGVGEFLEALAKVKDRDMLIVETSGLSDPYTIREAMEVSGFVPYVVVCVIPGDSWAELSKEPIFLAQIEQSDCIVVSKCDLLLPGELKELKNFLGDRLYFLCHEGMVDDSFFFFVEGGFEGWNGRRHIHQHTQSSHRFSQITLRLDNLYSMQDMEAFLNNLPKNIIRVKGFFRVLESPLPLGVNWTRTNLSWEPIDSPLDSFLTFIGYKGFILPPLPPSIKRVDWGRMVPLGEFDKRKGLAYLSGKAVDEIRAVEWLLDKDLEGAFLITTKESFECPFIVKERLDLSPTFEDVYKAADFLKNFPDNKTLLIWDIPDGYASYFVKELPNLELIHIGRHYLLPKASLSLRIDTEEKLEAIKRLCKLSI